MEHPERQLWKSNRRNTSKAAISIKRSFEPLKTDGPCYRVGASH